MISIKVSTYINVNKYKKRYCIYYRYVTYIIYTYFHILTFHFNKDRIVAAFTYNYINMNTCISYIEKILIEKINHINPFV